MDARVLKIRRKVEEGSRLTGAELEALKTAAASDPGVPLKLAVAHALSNAEEDSEALSLLTVLRRDFPEEVQVELGYARALAGLERYGEAEAALRRALELNPGDPEALKSLALMALRKGELERAQSHVDDALKRDPLDGEAQLIHAELQQNKGAVAPVPQAAKTAKALRPQFIDALLEALSSRQVHAVRQGKHLYLKLEGGKLGRVDLAPLYAAYVDAGESLAETVAAMAAELSASSDVPRTPEALLTRVRPVLRSSEFSQTVPGALQREGPAGLSIFYVLDDADLVRYVPAQTPWDLELALEAIDTAAFAQLEKRATELRPVIVDRGEPRLSPEPLGLFALCEADGYDAARLLCPAQQKKIAAAAGPGPYRVALGRRELALICGAADEKAVAMLQGLAASADGIEGDFALDAGRLERIAIR